MMIPFNAPDLHVATVASVLLMSVLMVVDCCSNLILNGSYANTVNQGSIAEMVILCLLKDKVRETAR